MKTPFLPLSLVGLLLAACAAGMGPARTEVQLDVSYEGDWGLTDFAMSVDGELRMLAAEPQVIFDVPDAWSGREIEVTIVGLRGDERFAHGSTLLTPVRGERVTSEVILTRFPCGAWCTSGATQCSEDGVEICEQRDDDSCMEWSDPVPCSTDAPFCSLGECRIDCVDECAEGETRCEGPGNVLACGEADSDTCLDWLPAFACETGASCADGACAAFCRDECVEGESRCFGAGVESCGDLNLDGCLEWSAGIPCGEGESCSASVCAPVESCVDECSANSCDGLDWRQCGNYDLDPCLELSSGTNCNPTDPCLEGRCTTGGCDTAVKVCMEPPAAECVDDDTLRTFDAVGECASDGTCSYRQTDRECLGCPACDACAGVICDRPPSGCFGPIGTCTSGSCTYPFADGAICSDGLACTTADECNSGTCVGAPVVCDRPPDSVCVDGRLRTYASIGLCGAGECTYSFSDAACAFGCSAGSCVPPVCLPSGWALETVTPTGNDVGVFGSIQIDDAGRVHIAYQDTTNGSLRYATKPAGGTWFRETVDSGGTVGTHTSLAVDSGGGIHISYYDETNEDLKYAFLPVGGSWTTETIDSSGDVGTYNSLAVDGSGVVHISYRRLTGTALKYATRSGGIWTIEFVDLDGDVGTYTSLALDGTGGLHISYYDATNFLLKYATRAVGGAWVFEAITTGTRRFRGTSLAIDDLGQVHVAAYDATTLDLRYALRTAGGTWSSEIIDAGGNVGLYPSLGVDGTGQVHISYFDQSNSDLKYISKVGGSWLPELLDSDGGVGSFTSLATDSEGRVHISYYDASNTNLKCATRGCL